MPAAAAAMEWVMYLSRDPRCGGSEAVLRELDAASAVTRDSTTLVFVQDSPDDLPMHFLAGTPTLHDVTGGEALEGRSNVLAALAAASRLAPATSLTHGEQPALLGQPKKRVEFSSLTEEHDRTPRYAGTVEDLIKTRDAHVTRAAENSGTM